MISPDPMGHEILQPAEFIQDHALPPGTAMVTIKIQRDGYRTISTCAPMDISFIEDIPAWTAHLTLLAERAWDKQKREGKL